MALQEIQRELASRAGHTVLDHRIVVCRQSIEGQEHGFFELAHHFLRQLGKHWA